VNTRAHDLSVVFRGLIASLDPGVRSLSGYPLLTSTLIVIGAVTRGTRRGR
jgi:hypothetical protein